MQKAALAVRFDRRREVFRDALYTNQIFIGFDSRYLYTIIATLNTIA